MSPNHREWNKLSSKRRDFHPVPVVNSSRQPDRCLPFQLGPLLSAIFQPLQPPRSSTAVHSVRLAACPPQQRFKSLTEPSRCTRSSINTVLGPTNHASRPAMPGRRANHNRRASRRHSTHCHHPASRGWERNKRLLEPFLAALSAPLRPVAKSTALGCINVTSPLPARHRDICRKSATAKGHCGGNSQRRGAGARLGCGGDVAGRRK